jgi:hypothetical protein
VGFGVHRGAVEGVVERLIGTIRRECLDRTLFRYPRVMQVIFYEAPFPAGEAIRRKALAAALETPAQIKWWV